MPRFDMHVASPVESSLFAIMAMANSLTTEPGSLQHRPLFHLWSSRSYFAAAAAQKCYPSVVVDQMTWIVVRSTTLLNAVSYFLGILRSIDDDRSRITTHIYHWTHVRQKLFYYNFNCCDVPALV